MKIKKEIEYLMTKDLLNIALQFHAHNDLREKIARCVRLYCELSPDWWDEVLARVDREIQRENRLCRTVINIIFDIAEKRLMQIRSESEAVKKDAEPLREILRSALVVKNNVHR